MGDNNSALHKSPSPDTLYISDQVVMEMMYSLNRLF